MLMKDELFTAQLVRAIGYAPYGGADFGECVAVASRIPGTDLNAWHDQWRATASRLRAAAETSLAAGNRASARSAFFRASNYFRTAGLFAMGTPVDPRLVEVHRLEVESFRGGAALLDIPPQLVEIPYEGKHIAGLYVRAESVEGPAPLLVQVNGLDSTKEMKYRVGLPAWLAKRGVASLIIDQPGTGEALRLHGLTARYDSEHWASRVFDWLETRADVDAKRIGLEGVSLGGYYCPRAVAFEPRFACGVAWGANHDWRDVQKRRLEKEGDFPVPHYWAHVRWVWGARDMDEFMRIAENVHLDGVLERIRVPFLVTHGEKDSQIPLKWAHRTYEQLVNSPKRELKIFTEREGGVQHSSFDNSINAGQYIADWVAETLGGRTT